MRSARLGSTVGLTPVLLTLSAFALSLQAQAVSPATCSEETIWTDIVGAERLYWEAIQTLDQWGEGQEAAEMFAQSAALRVRCDPQVFSLLRMSALLYQRAGNLEEAQRTMYRAAEVAVRAGKLLAAAHAYLDYAALSNELGETQAAVDAGTKAELISRLPALSDWAKLTIRDRMEWREAPAIPSASS